MTNTEDILRTIRLFTIPIGAAIVATGLVVVGESTVWDAYGIFILVFVVWMAWSIVSGLYPWSMRP